MAAAKRGDYATALHEFRALAQRDDAKGQNGLGVMYIKGWGVAKDDAQAVRWWRGHDRVDPVRRLEGLY